MAEPDVTTLVPNEFSRRSAGPGSRSRPRVARAARTKRALRALVAFVGPRRETNTLRSRPPKRSQPPKQRRRPGSTDFRRALPTTTTPGSRRSKALSRRPLWSSSHFARMRLCSSDCIDSPGRCISRGSMRLSYREARKNFEQGELDAKPTPEEAFEAAARRARCIGSEPPATLRYPQRVESGSSIFRMTR
jgi:hypothetical protein